VFFKNLAIFLKNVENTKKRVFLQKWRKTAKMEKNTKNGYFSLKTPRKAKNGEKGLKWPKNP
jgi:hypothetical protein